LVKRVAFAVPGDLATLSGGYGYDRRIIAELRALGWDVDALSLGDGFPRPSAEQRGTALSQLKALPANVPGGTLAASAETPASSVAPPHAESATAATKIPTESCLDMPSPQAGWKLLYHVWLPLFGAAIKALQLTPSLRRRQQVSARLVKSAGVSRPRGSVNRLHFE
jgi:hypothetical protein